MSWIWNGSILRCYIIYLQWVQNARIYWTMMSNLGRTRDCALDSENVKLGPMCRLWQCKRNQLNSHHFGRIPCQHYRGVGKVTFHPVQFLWGNLRRLLGSSQGLLKTSLSGSCKKWVGTCCLRLSTTNGSSCLHPPVRSLLWNFNFHWTKRLIWVGCALRHDETSSPHLSIHLLMKGEKKIHK